MHYSPYHVKALYSYILVKTHSMEMQWEIGPRLLEGKTLEFQRCKENATHLEI